MENNNQELIDRLKLEAQMHAQEARTANATIAEIYQLCSGGKGEPGNWHGAEPVRAVIAERDAIRQQAELSFDSPEALAMWLESLHECHPGGAVGNRKWQAAQVAASAIRAMGQDQASPAYAPSDMAASFRAGMNTQRMQQAERSGVAVSEVDLVDVVWKALDKVSCPGIYMQIAAEAVHAAAPLLRTAPAEQGGRVDEDGDLTVAYLAGRYDGKKAALAQNTQGEVCCCGDPLAARVHHRTDGPCYHAERARVPVDEKDAARYRFIRDEQATIIYKRKGHGEWEPLVDTYATSTRCASLDAAVDQAMLAAAPSQPEDAA